MASGTFAYGNAAWGRAGNRRGGMTAARVSTPCVVRGKAAGGRPCHYVSDQVAHPVDGSGGLGPERFPNAEEISWLDVAHPQVPDVRIDMNCQRAAPAFHCLVRKPLRAECADLVGGFRKRGRWIRHPAVPAGSGPMSARAISVMTSGVSCGSGIQFACFPTCTG